MAIDRGSGRLLIDRAGRRSIFLGSVSPGAPGTLLALPVVLCAVPIVLPSVLGYSALKTGLVISPVSVGIDAATPLAEHLSRRIGSRWTVAKGMLAFAGSLARLMSLVPRLATLTPDTPLTNFLMRFAPGGVGVGPPIAPVTSAAAVTVPRDQARAASGVLSTLRPMGTLSDNAILDAVLQSSIAGKAPNGVTAPQGDPAAIKQRIITAAGGFGPSEGVRGPWRRGSV